MAIKRVDFCDVMQVLFLLAIGVLAGVLIMREVMPEAQVIYMFRPYYPPERYFVEFGYWSMIWGA